jgi:hypothetical protein
VLPPDHGGGTVAEFALGKGLRAGRIHQVGSIGGRMPAQGDARENGPRFAADYRSRRTLG